ncbi:MAG TPA: LamG-like jellyroll fold domain-containing protein, partial [Verrucomicrobiales bacterium]|nr:LamG-like jellyroll fold domain-containing protein [Verrucomicrobiales bacterium]
GDIREIQAVVEGDELVLSMTVEGIITPSVEQTPEGKTNRYYYHWLLDTDNDPATGFSNSEYEGNQTNVANPIGGERVVQVGWRNGAPDGVIVYDPLNEQGVPPLLEDFPFESNGATMTARVPLSVLGVQSGQTIAFSAYQEGASDDWMVDWMESATLTIPQGDSTGIVSVEDPADLGDSSGDIALIQMSVDSEWLYVRMAVHGIITPSVEQTPEGKTNRYYYHWLFDTDNDPATGFSNSEYEGNPTNVQNPIGAELVIQVGWRNGAPDGVYAYDPRNEQGTPPLVEDYEWQSNGNSMEARLPLAALGLQLGQTVGFSAFQEGASDDWSVDWVESAVAPLVIPSAGNVDLIVDAGADPYAATAELVDDERGEVDESTVVLLIDGTSLDTEAAKTGGQTSARGLLPSPLAPETAHTLRVEYQLVGSDQIHGRTIPFTTPKYSILPPSYAATEVDAGATGFELYLTQISEAQSGVESLHLNTGVLAERQFSGEFRTEDGRLYYNEATGVTTHWTVEPMAAPGTINWYEDAPVEVGNFRTSTGRTDQPIPGLPGARGSTNGVVMEIVAYLELEPGFHRLGINTTGGYKVAMGPAVHDRLGQQVDQFDGQRRYSYEADHYFNVLVDEAGFYPLRLLWYHSRRTNQGAQLEVYSIADKRRILINDPEDPKALRSYRSSPVAPPFVRAASPLPGDSKVDRFAPVRFEIADGASNTVIVGATVLLDGLEAPARVERGDGVTIIEYQPYTFQWGSTHSLTLSYSYGDDPPSTRTETYQFGVSSDALELPAAWASPVAEAGESGFEARSVQSVAPRADSVAAAEAQLLTNGDFSGTAQPDTVNFNLIEGGQAGLVGGDAGLAEAGLMAAENTGYVSAEFTSHLWLTPGVHTFGVNSDDGFLLTAGRVPQEKTLELSRYDGGRGDSSTPQNLADVLVRREGLYAFRLLWYQGGGDASVEFYRYDRSAGTATLINSGEPGGIPAYRTRAADPGPVNGPLLAVEAELELPRLPLGSDPFPLAIWLYNAGAAALDVTSAVVSGADAEAFSVQSTPAVVAPGDSGAVLLSFEPGERIGRYTANLVLRTNDPGEPEGGTIVRLIGGLVDPAGPWAHYRLDDAEGSLEVSDDSGNGRTGAIWTGAGSATFGAAAIADGTALELDGGGAIRIAGSSFDTWRDLSVSLWVQAQDVMEPQSLFALGSDPTDPAFALVLGGGVLTWFGQGEGQLTTAEGLLEAGQGHHVVLTYRETGEGSIGSLWIDGVEAASSGPGGVAAFPGNLTTTLLFGTYYEVLPLSGVLDDIQIYGRALPGEDVVYLLENPGVALGAAPVVPGEDAGFISDVGFAGDGSLEVTIATVAGKNYTLQYSESLERASWIDLPGTVAGNGEPVVLSDDDPERLGREDGYYRVVAR